MVSIKDIAKQAGVSISTVSYALNGNPKVTEETTARILAVANELNYVPNAAARSLKRRETKIIGVFLTDFSGAFYGDLLQGVKEVLSVKGYDLIVCSGKQSHRMLPERLVDGAIILDETFASEELASYAERGHKLVVLDRELNHSNINQVLLDNKAGAALAVEFLLEQGHRKLYVLTGPRGSFDSRQRLAAATQVVERISGASLSVIEGDFNKSSGEHAAARLITDGVIRANGEPAAIFCFNDEMAIGMCHYLQRNHPDIIIGQDLHLIGFDNLELASYMHPRLSTIDYSKRKWGAIAAEQLLRLIGGQEVEQERIYVSLVRGETVGSASE